jgi:hypothetical protein
MESKSSTEGLRVVKHMDDMDPETVVKHINAAHVPYAGMQFVGKSRVPGDENEDLLRAWHAQVHARGHQDGRPLDHTHGKKKS